MFKSIKEKLKTTTGMDAFVVVSIIMLTLLVIGISTSEPSSYIVLK